MRSYFNKPSWASRGDEHEDSEFYRRSVQTYEDIVATKKNARERRANPFQDIPHKRRRVSSSSKDGGTLGSDNEQETATETNLLLENTPLPPKAPQHDMDLANPPVPRRASSSNLSAITNTKDIITPTLEELLDKKPPGLKVDSASLLPVTVNNGKADADTTCSQDKISPTETGAPRADQNTAYNNAVVQILITSNIANTKPLIIHRKMSQSLKGVRLAWCARQDIPKEFHSTVFLTWKGRRLFDVTTCRSLNIDAHSVFTRELLPFDEYFSNNSDYRICMEAVTEKTFTAGYRSSPNLVGPEPTSPTAAASQDAEQHARSEIILKCPGLDDFKILAALTTRISHVVGAFREARGISPDLTVSLAFDGDRLDSQSCLADYEITDGDLVDVLVKK
ncbi:hypothetical protein BDV12DRAFT_92072 [Aspergillus spectabilis]